MSLTEARQQLAGGVVLEDGRFRAPRAGVLEAAMHDIDGAVWRRLDRRDGGPLHTGRQFTPRAGRLVGLWQVVARLASLLGQGRQGDQCHQREGNRSKGLHDLYT